MKSNYLYIFMWLSMMCSFCVSAQDDKLTIDTFSIETPFLYLNDGTLLLDDEFTMEEKLEVLRFKDKNGKKIKRKQIKFYQDDYDYYGKYNGGFKPRISKGTFDVFFKIEEYKNFMRPERGDQVTETYYYAKGFGDLKTLTYNNLKNDLSVFSNSNFPKYEKEVMDYLRLGKKRFRTKWIMIGSGIALLGIGAKLSNLGKRDEKVGLRKTGRLLGVGGVGLGLSSFLIPKPKDAYYNALITYNMYF